MNNNVSVLSTPVKARYQERIAEKYDVDGASPVFDTFKRLTEKAHMNNTDITANSNVDSEPVPSTSSNISPTVKAALIYPSAVRTKLRPKRLIQKLPDNLTSDECIRQMAINDLQKVKNIAEREKKAKARYLSKNQSAKEKAVEKSNARMNSSRQNVSLRTSMFFAWCAVCHGLKMLCVQGRMYGCSAKVVMSGCMKDVFQKILTGLLY